MQLIYLWIAIEKEQKLILVIFPKSIRFLNKIQKTENPSNEFSMFLWKEFSKLLSEWCVWYTIWKVPINPNFGIYNTFSDLLQFKSSFQKTNIIFDIFFPNCYSTR